MRHRFWTLDVFTDRRFAGNPLAGIFAEMMGGAAKAEPKRKANPSGRARNPYDDLFDGMFESGARQRDEYAKSMEQIFDRFLAGTRKG